MPGLNLKAAQWEQQHKTHVEEYLRQIEALYDVASDELFDWEWDININPIRGDCSPSHQTKAVVNKPMPRYLHSEISCPL